MANLSEQYNAVMAALSAAPRPATGLDAVHDLWLTVRAAHHTPGRKPGTHSLTLEYSTQSGIDGEVKVTVQKYARLLDQPDVFAYLNTNPRPPFRVKFSYIAGDDDHRGKWLMDLDIGKP